MAKKVYVNRTLNMKRITHIGFDMDHTLVRYNSEAFEGFTHGTVLKKLVSHKKYPSSVLSLPFDFQSAIRGLVIDKNRGNVLKLSRHGAIKVSRHGSKNLDFLDQRKLYKSTYVDLGDEDFESIDTAFSIAYACLFMQLVDLKDKGELPNVHSYRQISEDIMSMLDWAHRDDSLKSEVRGNLSKYLIQDPETVQGLERYKRHGKSVFVVTNSDFPYCKVLLDYAINPFLKENKNWQELFSFVIASAEKPKFFYERNAFRLVDVASETERPLKSKIVPGVYSGGGAHQFTEDLGLEPDQILYVGDHIYGDILRLKKDCAWRTALVVDEIEREIHTARKVEPITLQINQLMEQKYPLEIEYNNLMSERIEKNVEDPDPEAEALLKKIKDIDEKISPLIRQQQMAHNPNWGELMYVGVEESYFAYQVERFACVYMAKISDLLKVSPRTYFRSFRKLMPHEH